MSAANNKIYFAIIGDIVGSRQLKDRASVQEKLASLLKKINETYETALSSNFTITLGDEFQGLLSSGSEIMAIIEEIEREMHPLKIRFAIGVGEITTSINREISLGADGPAYYNARELIDLFKSFEKKKVQAKSNIIIRADSLGSKQNLVNSIFSLNYYIKERWSDKQREIINCYIEQHESQVMAAHRLGINQSSVQRSLQKSGYYAYKNAVSSITSILKELNGDEYV